ncbi:MAG: ABC transporter ATP-binding protein [Acidobacteria bacterium]|nr:ABC transporter ATP-binding protein [Acidobacteriota bacterium]
MLQIERLTKRYAGGTVALDQFSIELGPGVLGLLGPNGAGKTTLMSILATVLRPTSGSVRWKGNDALENPAEIRRVLGYLPQDFGVYDRLTGVEFLQYLGRLKGLSGRGLRASVDEMIDLVNLRNAASRPLGGYSGGMRQRIGIAQALLGNPEIVIVDEPTVGLDPEERVRFRNLLSELAHGRIVILSTHIVSDVEAVADRIAVIRKGKLVRIATPGELLAHAAGRVFRVVVGAEQLPQLQQSVAVSSISRKADGVHVRFVADTPRIGGAVEAEPTLEDAYLLTNVEAA